jgi:hypothetical protein
MGHFTLILRYELCSLFNERLSNITLRLLIKVKEQLVVRKDIDVNKHERLSNITLRLLIKVKEQLVVFTLINSLSVMLDSLS